MGGEWFSDLTKGFQLSTTSGIEFIERCTQMDWFVKHFWNIPDEIWKALDAIRILEHHLDLIEEQINNSQELLRNEWNTWKRKEDDPDLGLFLELRSNEFLAPRILRNSFLVSLFTLYESITMDAAEHIKKSKGKILGIKDIKGGLIPRTETYYRDVLGFRLLKAGESQERLEALAKLRNFIVHENGRFKYGNEQQKDAILKIDKGIEEQDGYVVVSRDFLRDTFLLVKSELEALMERYTNWQISQK